MDELDHNLLDAWHRVMERCRKDPAEARRRWRRSRSPSYRRHPRAWCLALRAGDTRIEDHAVWEDISEAKDAAARQRVEIPSDGLRELCAPVRIPWPGVPLARAVKLVGRHPESLRRYLPRRQGRTREVIKQNGIRRYEVYRDPKSPLVVQYCTAQSDGHFGVDVPFIWTEQVIDPADRLTRRPHPIWGSLWQWLYRRIVAKGSLCVERTERWVPYGGSERFRGWYWTCPGRKDPAALSRGEDRRLPCGRRVSVLYMPMQGQTVGGFVDEWNRSLRLDDAVSHDRSELRLVGQWQPGGHEPGDEARCFACRHCWQVSWNGLLGYQDWNSFVTYISGGLLYGREVERPEWATYQRKQAYRARTAAAPVIAQTGRSECGRKVRLFGER